MTGPRATCAAGPARADAPTPTPQKRQRRRAPSASPRLVPETGPVRDERYGTFPGCFALVLRPDPARPGHGTGPVREAGPLQGPCSPVEGRPASGVAPCVMKDTELASLSPQCSLGVASGVARRQPRQARKLRNSRNWPASCATRATTVNVRTREAAEAPAACLRHREKLMLEPFTPPSGVADNLDSRRRARDGRETGDS